MRNDTESELVSFLTKKDDSRPLFVLYGEEGVGKTTLVQKVYNKPEVRQKFMGCFWITVTKHVQAKTLWKDILSQIHYGKKDEINKYTYPLHLVPELQSALEKNKCLIVLDGISSMEALLEDMLTPKISSRVVITTRNKDKTLEILDERKMNYFFEEMKPLAEDQCWELFRETHLSGVSERNVKLLEEVCRKCAGVPLAINLLGNLMAWKERVAFWNKIKELQQRRCVSARDLWELSYSLLEGHLKKCLHYLALFPEDTDIEAEKLCNLWIAEEMIRSQLQGDGTMLSKAETSCLKKLATVGLVQVQEEEETPTPTPTKIKSCRLPRYVRDFCIRKGREESKFAIADLRPGQPSPSASSDGVRALAFYFDKRVGDKYEFPLPPKETHKEVRSILFLNTHQQDEYFLSPKSLDLKNCKLLRALDFNWLDFHLMKKFPENISNLADHLRYLSFRDCNLEMEELPTSIGKLKKLETLDLRVNKKLLLISNLLCKLRNLRSLYLPNEFEAKAVGGNKKLELDGLTALENLQNFVSTHCRANDLDSLKNLRYLAATIDGVKDLEVTIRCINSKGAFQTSSIHLKNIDYNSPYGSSLLSDLLACEFLNALHLHGQIRTLPSWPTSSKLTEIFLIASELSNDPMPVLGNLPLLQKLSICERAFLGKQMTCTRSGFPQLRYLKLSNLPDLDTWALEETAMPKLSTLTIENCKSLKTLPDGLLKTLPNRLSTHIQELSIVNMPETFMKTYAFAICLA